MKPAAVSHLGFLSVYKLGALTSFNFMEKNQSQGYFYDLIHVIPMRLSKSVP